MEEFANKDTKWRGTGAAASGHGGSRVFSLLGMFPHPATSGLAMAGQGVSRRCQTTSLRMETGPRVRALPRSPVCSIHNALNHPSVVKPNK